MKKLALALAFTAALASPALAATTAQCPSAVDRYNSEAETMLNRVRRLSNCIAASRGEDDCGGEFSRVKSQYGEFESAVNNYGDECD
jgi:hypothetical protein